MAKEQRKDSKRVVFRKIGGRVVPILVGGAGAAVAADAAMTKRVYQTKNITIDRKAFAYSPVTNSIDTALKLKVKGESAGRIMFSGKPGEPGSISWLSIKKKFRGQGLSKVLAKQAAIELKSSGVKSISSHVVHERSSNLFKGKVRSTWWKEVSEKNGVSSLIAVDKKTALRSVARWRKERGLGKAGSLSIFGALKGKIFPDKAAKKVYKYASKAVFRDVYIPKNLKRQKAAFMTIGSKLRMVGGIAMVAAAIAHSFRKSENE